MSDQLRSIRERWERLEADKKAISDDLKELFAEAKGNGFDTKALRLAFRTLAKSEGESESDKATREQAELYMAALLGTAPLAHTRDTREKTDLKLVETIVQGVQTETGRKALTKALDVMIEATEEGPLTLNGLTADSYPADHKMHVRDPVTGKSRETTFAEFWNGLVARHLEAAA